MSNYIFDIETGPRSRAELAECVPTFEAPSNWKDSEKIRAYVAEKEAEWFQSAALSALTGRVLAIGYLDAVTDELGYFASGDEAADLAAEDLVGRTLRARLKVEEFNGRANNKVEAWLAPLAGSGNAPAPASLPAPLASPASPAAAPTTSTNPAQEDASNEPF